MEGLAAALMRELGLQFPAGVAPTLLFIGAHCDDIEIGCGATVQALLRRYRNARVHWVVLSGNALRRREALRAARRMLAGARGPVVSVQEFKESHFPSDRTRLKEYFETLKAIQPDVIFSHYGGDLHQDHRVVSELVWNTFRNHTVFEYEIPKFDGGMGSPQVFVPADAAAVRRKVAVLMRCFASQASKSWFTPETFSGLMRLRGIECNSAGGYAEAYYVRKLVLAADKSGSRR